MRFDVGLNHRVIAETYGFDLSEADDWLDEVEAFLSTRPAVMLDGMPPGPIKFRSFQQTRRTRGQSRDRPPAVVNFLGQVDRRTILKSMGNELDDKKAPTI